MIESFKSPRQYQIDFCRLLKLDALLKTFPHLSLSLPFLSRESLKRHPTGTAVFSRSNHLRVGLTWMAPLRSK